MELYSETPFHLYIFMQKKTKSNTMKFFLIIKSRISKHLDFINIDYKSALLSTLSGNFSNSNLHECVFHLSQIIMRQIKPRYI